MNGHALRILKWVALGKSDLMIAEILSVSEHDIRLQIQDISKELNAKDRVDMSLKAIELDLV